MSNDLWAGIWEPLIELNPLCQRFLCFQLHTFSPPSPRPPTLFQGAGLSGLVLKTLLPSGFSLGSAPRKIQTTVQRMRGGSGYLFHWVHPPPLRGHRLQWVYFSAQGLSSLDSPVHKFFLDVVIMLSHDLSPYLFRSRSEAAHPLIKGTSHHPLLIPWTVSTPFLSSNCSQALHWRDHLFSSGTWLILSSFNDEITEVPWSEAQSLQRPSHAVSESQVWSRMWARRLQAQFSLVSAHPSSSHDHLFHGLIDGHFLETLSTGLWQQRSLSFEFKYRIRWLTPLPHTQRNTVFTRMDGNQENCIVKLLPK